MPRTWLVQSYSGRSLRDNKEHYQRIKLRKWVWEMNRTFEIPNTTKSLTVKTSGCLILLDWPAGTRPALDLLQYFSTLNSVEEISELDSLVRLILVFAGATFDSIWAPKLRNRFLSRVLISRQASSPRVPGLRTHLGRPDRRPFASARCDFRDYCYYYD